MSTFGIYAVVLSTIYFPYIVGNILWDMVGYHPAKKKEVEVYDVPEVGNGDDEADDNSVMVIETENGYSVGNSPAGGDSNAANQGDSNSGNEESGQDAPLPPDDIDDDDLLEQESRESLASYESLKAIQIQMDAVTPVYQDEYSSDDFAVLMAQPLNQRTRILRNIVRL